MAQSNLKESEAPLPAANSKTVSVLFQAEQLASIDDWSARQTDKPGRPEAVRRLLSMALSDRWSGPR
jgi:hypothetical protein